MNFIKKKIPFINKKSLILLVILGFMLPIIELASIKCLSLNYLSDLHDISLWIMFLFLFITRLFFIYYQQLLATNDRSIYLKNYHIALCEVYLEKNQKIEQRKILDLLYHRSSMAADATESLSYLLGPLCSILIYILALTYLYSSNFYQIIIICIPFIVIAYYLKKLGLKNIFEQNHYFAHLYKIIQYKLQIIANDAKKFFINNLTKSSIEYTESEKIKSLNRSKLQLMYGIIFSINLVIINIVSIEKLGIDTKQMILINIILLKIVFSLSEAAGHVKRIQTNYKNYLKSVVILNQSHSIVSPLGKSETMNKLEFGPLTIGYNKAILKIPAQSWSSGQIILLKGSSGRGKSTYLKTIMGIIPPITGQLPPQNLNLSYADQIPLIISGDIDTNIILNKEVTLEDYIDISKKIACIDFKNTSEYSLGQSQRINIARTIFSNKSVIIWDEATSNIDIETEVKIANNLKNFNKSRLIIISTHRNSFDHVADQKINFDEETYAIS